VAPIEPSRERLLNEGNCGRDAPTRQRAARFAQQRVSISRGA
jgi:hypothetical protein